MVFISLNIKEFSRNAVTLKEGFFDDWREVCGTGGYS